MEQDCKKYRNWYGENSTQTKTHSLSHTNTHPYHKDSNETDWSLLWITEDYYENSSKVVKVNNINAHTDTDTAIQLNILKEILILCVQIFYPNYK